MSALTDVALSLALLAAVASGIVLRRRAGEPSERASFVPKTPTQVATFAYDETGALVGHRIDPVEGRTDEQPL